LHLPVPPGETVGTGFISIVIARVTEKPLISRKRESII
jgi:hypothetical protein